MIHLQQLLENRSWCSKSANLQVNNSCLERPRQSRASTAVISLSATVILFYKSKKNGGRLADLFLQITDLTVIFFYKRARLPLAGTAGQNIFHLSISCELGAYLFTQPPSGGRPSSFAHTTTPPPPPPSHEGGAGGCKSGLRSYIGTENYDQV